MKIINVEPWITNAESHHLSKVIKKTFLTENKETELFEKNIRQRFNSKVAITVNNWTSGLFIILKALNLKKDDEVIIPNLTFIATANAVIYAGAKPVLCDIDPKNLSIDLKKVKKLISKKTKCIIPVHLYGHCCNLDELKKISGKNIVILEDAAQAIGAKFKNNFLGTIGDFGGYSFYGNKIITTGEGGVILTNKKSFKKKLYMQKNHGRHQKGSFKDENIGFNFMFTELQAALGISQLNKFDKILKKRDQIFDFYRKNINDKDKIKFHLHDKSIRPLHWFVNITAKNVSKISRELKKRGFQTRKLFYPLNLQPCYKNHENVKNLNDDFKISKKTYQNVLSLPTFHNIKKKI